MSYDKIIAFLVYAIIALIMFMIISIGMQSVALAEPISGVAIALKTLTTLPLGEIMLWVLAIAIVGSYIFRRYHGKKLSRNAYVNMENDTR